MAKQTKNSFRYIEDNGGGLHLFVFDVNDKVVGGITNLEYAGEGEWDAVKDSMSIDALEEIRRWEGHMSDHGIDPAEFYAEIMGSDFGYNVVCDNGTLYPDTMGRAAEMYFGIDID